MHVVAKSLSWTSMVALGAGLLLAGCEQRTARALPSAPASGPTPASLAVADPTLFTRRALLEALTKLEDTIGAPPRALELSIHRDHLVLQAQNPKQLDQVLQYEYRGGAISKPVEVKLRGKGDLEANLFPLADVKLERVPELCEQARRQVDGAGGRVTQVHVRRNLPDSMDVQLRVYVASPLRDGYIDADQDGHVIEPAAASPRTNPSAPR